MNILTIKVFQREIMYAKTFIKLHELQQQYLIELRKAFDEKDVMILNQLIMKADRLDMASHEFVLKAKLLLSKLYEKRNVIQQMIRFLQNEQDDDLHSHLYQNNSKKSFVSEDIDGYQNGDESKDDDEFFGQAKMKILLEKARELGVDSEFVAKVDRVYISTGPRIEARSLLRRAIETVDRYGIIKVSGTRIESMNMGQGFNIDIDSPLSLRWNSLTGRLIFPFNANFKPPSV